MGVSKKVFPECSLLNAITLRELSVSKTTRIVIRGLEEFCTLPGDFAILLGLLVVTNHCVTCVHKHTRVYKYT